MSKRPSNRIEGTIKRLVTDRGFGFIRIDSGEEFFFHQSVLTNCSFAQLSPNMAVSFVPENGPKGPRASDVTLL